MTIKLDTFRVLRLICPSCQSVAAVRRQRQMISLAPSGKSPPLVSAGPRLLKRGASRSSRTLVRAAMDAKVSNDERHFSWTAKSCGPGLSTLRSTRGNASHCAGMVTTRPDHQGEHEGNRKTIRAGKAGVAGQTCGDLLVCFFLLHARLRVRLASGFPRSLCQGGK